MKNDATLHAFIKKWLTLNVISKVRDSSLANYERHCGYIEKYFGSCKISTIDQEKIYEFIYFLSNNKKFSNGTSRLILTTLKSIFKYAYEYQYICKNPCLGLKLPPKKEKETVAFTKQEQCKIETEIMKQNDVRELAILICLYTGLRLGEICALKWENIDFTNRFLYVKKSVSRIKNYDAEPKYKTKLIETEPKTEKSKRYLPLPEFLIRFLAEHKEKKAGKYIISAKRNPNCVIQPRTLQHIFKRLLVKAKVGYQNFHVLRHTFATRSIELGADVKSLSEILGHSNVQITLNRYTHSLVDQKRKIMSQLDHLFTESMIN